MQDPGLKEVAGEAVPASRGLDLRDTPDESAFRLRARAWLEEHAPPGQSGATDHATRLAVARDWQRRLWDGGWAGLTWPTAHGGQDLPGRQAAIFQQEESRFLDWHVVKGPYNVAFNLVAPAILAHGTPAQQARHLAALLRGDELWCQLFSEPDAGSDLANLATTATRMDAGFLVQGQKVWSSYAHYAHFGLLLARTDPDATKHRGLSAFLLDMAAPGVTVRPIHQMTGASEFNEVFFDDVVISGDALLGAENDGWRIAHGTLLDERQYLGVMTSTQPRFPGLLALAPEERRPGASGVRQRLADCYIREQVLGYLGLRLQTAVEQHQSPAAVPSLLKLAQSRHVVRTAEDGVVSRPAAALGAEPGDVRSLAARAAFVASPGFRIGGGTDNMQRQGVAERVLGLPREASPDRVVSWRQLRNRAGGEEPDQ